MSPLWLLLCLAPAILAEDIIDGEFMLGLNRDRIYTEKHEADFSKLLKAAFNADVQRFYHFNEMTLVFVKGDKVNMDRVAKLPEVTYVEPNQLFYTTQTCSSESRSGVWGLDRVDQVAGLSYSNPADTGAVYDTTGSEGSGVSVYVIDTGIRTTHNDFGGRATWGYSAGNLGNEDGNGHGTHCAGTVGGSEYGVSPGASLVAVKVMTDAGFGSTADIVEGMQWVEGQNTASTRSVASMSLGGGISASLDNAVTALHNDGVTVVTAAGNSDADACNSSPGRAPLAYNVCATDINDACASFSNYGSCVDICAPGVSILSAWINSDVDTNRISGTSMACPHVAGAAAKWIATQGSVPSPDQVQSALTSAATNINVGCPGVSTPDRLLYSPC